jgi:pilus assembly protein CpaB
MQLRTVLLLLVALSMAGATAFLVNGWLTANKTPVVQAGEAPAPKPMTEVLVATEELMTGTFLKPDHLEWRPWPKDGINEGYYVKGQSTAADFEGAIVRSRLYPGEPITKRRVVHPGEKGFLAAVLEPGLRAIAVPVDATSGVAGFVFPGDLVDVLLTLRANVRPDEEEGGQAEVRHFSQTLLSGIRVLGVDQVVDNENNGPRVAKTATLEVTSRQAERIAVALQLGELSLTLHSIGREGPEAAPEILIGGANADTTADTSADTTGRESTGTTARTAARADGAAPGGGQAATYTRDMDVLDMMGDPWGLPYPNGVGPKVNIVRGSDSSVARF